ncbi:hypothetical protein GB928_018295 [Shinella curvata]|uniref:Uncharacterized protein n=1 Tax=Shinella curvata TaxID=1817964 RepID=A0ABT8XHD3_9HYPH|nr:hypothetical protein [Shinella curvata]MCJ8053810.1 hypothetical protein [Shinella curvata]MDO6123142.1 hypothetical protein [Shinella curvata]
MMLPDLRTARTVRVDIFIAGDHQQAKQVCREWCMENGACVTVEPVDYIYTGGEEAGVRVGFINYPRFPASEAYITGRAENLAARLMLRLCQHSYSIVGPEETTWYSRRPEDALSASGGGE